MIFTIVALVVVLAALVGLQLTGGTAAEPAAPTTSWSDPEHQRGVPIGP